MRLIGLVVGAALAATLASSALADPAKPVPAAPLTVTPLSPEIVARRMARRAARLDQDIQTLHAGLHLSAAQDALWPPVAAAIRDVDTARGFRFRQVMAAAPSTIDAVKLQGDHMAAMGAAMSKLADATKPFVASLDADQKSKLPGLLESVRLPKVMSRALGVPQDTGSSSWGSDEQAGPAGGGAKPSAAPAGTAAGPQAGASQPSSTGGAKPSQDDEE